MTIGSIGSTSYTGQMFAMGNRSGMEGTMAQKGGMGKGPNPAEMFGKVDSNNSEGLDQTEFVTLANKINEATGEDVDVEEIFAAYDEDGDGELSEAETQSVMDDHHPEGPPPPPPPKDGGMGKGQNPAEMFSEVDSDDSGGLDQTEFDTLADMISEATGEYVDVEEIFAAYDEDEDGELSEAETQSVMEDHRPEGPPPPPPPKNGGGSTGSVSGIDMYMKMAAMGDSSSSESQGISQSLNALA